MNKATFSGNLGGDAIIKDTAGKKVMEFSVGVAIGTKDNPQTQWVKCSKWSEKTALAPYLLKGTKVIVYGDVNIQTYVNQSGATVANLTLIVDNVELVGGKQTDNVAQPVQQQAEQQQTTDESSDLPF